MARMKISERFDAPVDRVFDVMADLENAAKNITGIGRSKSPLRSNRHKCAIVTRSVRRSTRSC